MNLGDSWCSWHISLPVKDTLSCQSDNPVNEQLLIELMTANLMTGCYQGAQSFSPQGATVYSPHGKSDIFPFILTYYSRPHMYFTISLHSAERNQALVPLQHILARFFSK